MPDSIQPREHRLRPAAHAAELAWYEWGEPGSPVVLLLHATGFHARCWNQVVAGLGAGYHVIAVDHRGHGRSEQLSPFTWREFTSDCVAFVEALSLHPAIGVGHSMGGHCVTHAAAVTGVFDRLLLVDPVIMAPERYRAERHLVYASADDMPIARRRDHFRDWQEMFDRLAGREPFSLWQTAVLADYCRYGVVDDPDGDGVRLACPPRVEAAVYFGNTGYDPYPEIARVGVPVTVLRAPPRDPDAGFMDFSGSPTWPGLAGAFPRGRDVYLKHLTHFIPMQDPGLVAGFIRDPDAVP